MLEDFLYLIAFIILSALFLNLSWLFLILLFVVLLFRKRQKWVIFFILFLATLFASRLYYLEYKKVETISAFENLLSRKEEHLATIRSVDKRLNKSFVYADIEKNGKSALVKFSCYICFDFVPGQRYLLFARVDNVENFSDKFDYKNYLYSKLIYFTGQIYDYTFLEEGRGVLNFLYKIKNFFIEKINRSYSYERAALASGVVLGEKQALPYELKQAFSISALTHIVVLSGFNISILASFIFVLLFFITRKLRAIVSIVAISLFVVMVGADPPTLRAAIMGSFAFLAIFLGKDMELLPAFVLAFVIMSFAYPHAFLYDPGFQMSFVATFALVVYLKYIMFKYSLSSFWGLILSTILAFVSVLPLASFYGFSSSVLGVFANFLVLPIVPALMLLVFLASIFPYGSLLYGFFVFLSDKLLAYVIFVAESIAKIGQDYILVLPANIYLVSVFYISYFLLGFYLNFRIDRQSEGKI